MIEEARRGKLCQDGCVAKHRLFLPAAKPTGPRTMGVVVFQRTSLMVNIISSIVLGIPQFPLIFFLGWDPLLTHKISLQGGICCP